MLQRCLPAPSWLSWAGGRADWKARAFGHTFCPRVSGQGHGIPAAMQVERCGQCMHSGGRGKPTEDTTCSGLEE
jgi:hypothetical protein